jgi:hypothetical protein
MLFQRGNNVETVAVTAVLAIDHDAAIAAKEAEIERLREALAFYASEENQECGTGDDGGPDYGYSNIAIDRGDIARAALGVKHE